MRLLRPGRAVAPDGCGALSNRLPLVLVLVGYAALALGHNLIVPVGESPDEPTHLEYVYYLRTERSLPHLSEPEGLGIVQGGPFPA